MPAYVSKTIEFDSIATEAFMSFRDEAYDQFYKSNPFFRKVFEDGNVKKKDHTSGKEFQVNVNYARSRQTKAWDGLQDITPKRADHKMPSHWQWSNIACPMLIAEVDRKVTAGAPLGHAVDLLVDEFDSSMQDMIAYFAERLFEDGTAESNMTITGLAALVDSTPATGTLAGINRAKFSFWQNNAISGTLSMLASGPGGATNDYFQDMWYNCSDGDNHPNIIVTDEATYKFLERQVYGGGLGAANSTPLMRFASIDNVDLGVMNLNYKGTEIIYDKNCPAGYMYFLSTPTLQLIVDKEWDFYSTGWMSMRQNYQFADANIIVWRGEFIITQPMFNGVTLTWGA